VEWNELPTEKVESPKYQCQGAIEARAQPSSQQFLPSGERLYSPQYLKQIADQSSAGWESKNLELVLKVNVIGSKAVPPLVIAATVW
jgi:hypothetical protein